MILILNIRRSVIILQFLLEAEFEFDTTGAQWADCVVLYLIKSDLLLQ